MKSKSLSTSAYRFQNQHVLKQNTDWLKSFRYYIFI